MPARSKAASAAQSSATIGFVATALRDSVNLRCEAILRSPQGNANFTWVKHFIHHLAPQGLTGFVVAATLVWSLFSATASGASDHAAFFEKHCTDCHDATEKKGGLDLTALKADFTSEGNFAAWVKVHDRIQSGEMPPKKNARPAEAERGAFLAELGGSLVEAEAARRKGGRSTLRRLNRTEYENTLRDLLGLPALDVRDLLPEDGRVLGYDKAGRALDFSTVQIAKYLDAASKALPLAIAPYPERDEAKTVRLYAGDDGGIMDGIINGDGVCLKDFKYDDSLFPLSVPSGHVPTASGFAFFDQLTKEGKIPYRGAIGFMRNGDDSQPDFGLMSPVVPGFYKVRVSLWGFRWDKTEVKPTTPQIGRLMVNGRHSGSKEVIVGYFDAPSLKPALSESVAWLNPGDSLKFQPISVEHDWQGIPRNKLATYTGDGVAVDWLEVEGPLVETWPGVGHRRLFGELPLVKFDGTQRPPRRPMGQFRGGPQPFVLTPKHQQSWTVASADPAADAEKLLASFLPLAFRRPVEREEVQAFADIAQARLAEKATFEEAMLAAYQAALCSPEFLFLRETPGRLDDYALASRLSYFLWASMPDDELLALAAAKKLGDPKVLRAQTERMLADAKAARFITDFTYQWLDLRLVDDNTPHSKLYPEFSPLLRDSMVGETRAFFRELLTRDLPAANIVHSDFAMLDQTLARFYGGFEVEDFTIPQEKPQPKQARDTLPRPIAAEVAGTAFRRVALTADSQRGGFLTQAAILKVTANGTTTSPVRRGAWVQRKIVGQPPEPPPPNIPAIEPDTRGLTTLREILEKHRADVSCAGCHAIMDPPGFALESYDAIGGFRPRFRSLEKGDRITRPPACAGRSEFLLGLPVDASGELADGRSFKDIREFKQLLLADEPQIARNFASQLIVYATGAPVSFADRAAVERMLTDTAATKHGIRSLLHAVVQSEIFRNK